MLNHFFITVFCSVLLAATPSFATRHSLTAEATATRSLVQDHKDMLMKEECEAIAVQPTLKKFFGINDCNQEWNRCAKCNNTAVMVFNGDRVSYLRCPYEATVGQLPAEFRVLKKVTSIQLMVDHRTDSTLPPEWSEMESLAELVLINGCLRGPLPKEWSKLTTLTRLLLQYNELTGSLPESWSTLVNLRDLDLSGNMFEGPLPTSWGAMTQLTSLRLARNWITGSLPATWGNMQNLANLDLKHNHLHGSLPDQWSRLQSLASMHLSSNRLMGTIPDSWSNMTSLVILTLGWNRLCGPIPDGAPTTAAQHCAEAKWPGAVGSLISCDLLPLQHVAHAYSSDSKHQHRREHRGDGSMGGKSWLNDEPLPDEFGFQNGTESPMFDILPPRPPHKSRPLLVRLRDKIIRRAGTIFLVLLGAVAVGILFTLRWYKVGVRDVLHDLSYRKEILKALVSRSPSKFRDRKG